MSYRSWMVTLSLLALGLTGCSSSSGGGVTMAEGHRFEPSTITIKAGDTLEWTNDSGESHTVTAYDDGVPEGGDYFASGGFENEAAARDDVSTGLIRQGETFEATFAEPGTYEYFCIPHESSGMKGSVVVEP